MKLTQAELNDALHWASRNGHVEVVKLLLANGASISAYNNGALRYASYNGHAEVVKVLNESLRDHV